MSIKLALLKSGENVIADVKEGFFEEKLVCYVFDNPCRVTVNGVYQITSEDSQEETGNRYNVSLQRWPVLSKDTSLQIVPDWIVTLSEPVDNLRELYETEVLGNIENEESETANFTEQSDSDQSD